MVINPGRSKDFADASFLPVSQSSIKGKKDADDADGQIHVKYPAPAQVLGDDAAEGGPQRRRAACPQAVNAQGQAALLLGKNLAENYHADRHDDALADALAETGHIHHADAGSLAADGAERR